MCGQPLGRFCHIDESIMALVKEIADFEQRQTPDVIFAEISHLPESRIGNIASRPVFRNIRCIICRIANTMERIFPYRT